MDNPKNNAYYTKKIIEDIRFMIAHTEGLSYESLLANEVLLDSIMFRLIQISENSDKLTDEFKERYSAVPWRAMKGMRNRIVHQYGDVDLSIIYETVLHDIPMLLKTIEETLV